jgi:hypothetical protein
MLLFEKSNGQSTQLETAVTWSKSNLDMMIIYEKSINCWMCVDALGGYTQPQGPEQSSHEMT